MYNRAPRSITPPIFQLCQKIVENPRPCFVRVTPFPSAKPRDCFPTVERQVQEAGGSICYGWAIWEAPDIFVEAEFHAVWVNPDGEMYDLTPRDNIVVDKILFLPDPVRKYEGRQVDNVRHALLDHPLVHSLLETFSEEFEIMNRGDRALHHAISISPQEQRRLGMLSQMRRHLQSEILKLRPSQKQGRNDPCKCGSGKKHKKCCGQ